MVLDKEMLVPLKRVEIVIDEDDFEEFQEICRAINIRGYTYISQAGGFGTRGNRRPNDMSLPEKNILVIIACTEDQAETLAKNISSGMKEKGGIFLISDCDWVKGPKISY
ncbi:MULTISPECIES: P-II family nitrogen regulator [Nitrosomonas]|uniref:Nitrogen regulatory protein P-II 1 n=2 Tax=Nitrosomonas communis TaxID=44574 RepID=A0A5D3YK88_9PROT|nr:MULTISPECIES: transcriptional regulator [Nitrosomonas]TYP93029.1 nitrogen regulatory protein P-II 1 [Nitrosomonas communis]UVS60620.1 transcriptional regulator [Nitrosomonas sp. PLL12]